MLERATACLKSGAARESLRCVAKAPRSKRMLHSAFWTHGAGDLDQPPWAVSMLPMPADLPLRHDDKRSEGGAELGRGGQKGQHSGHGITDGIFLDFLYPQQALALLHKRSAQQSQRWEKRNARRLSDGFVVASRGYASRSRTAKAERATKQQVEREKKEQSDDEYRFPEEPATDKDPHTSEASEKWWETPSRSSKEREGQQAEEETIGFANSPMDLAEPSPEAIRKLRNIMSFNRKEADEPKRARDNVEQAWRLYQTIDDVGQDDGRLKTEFLSWLNTQQADGADAYCAELYHSMPASQRTLQVYEVALSMFMRRNQHLSASKLHREALRNLENGHQISRTLFRYTIDNELWRLAIRTEGRHKEFYGESSQMRLFWLHVSEIPQLLSKAMKLLSFLEPAVKMHRIDSHTHQFCKTFFKEAVTQEFLQADASLYTVPAVSKQNPPRDRIRLLFSRLSASDEQSSNLCEATLVSLIGPHARIPYARMHNLVTSIYNMYKSTHGIRPSERLLLALLHRVTRYADRLREDKQTHRSLSVASVVRDWRKFHSRLTRAAHVRLVTYYARSGRVEQHEAAMDCFKEEHPDPEKWKDVLWTSIYMHARRADLDCAQQAFAAVKRELAELGDEPDLKCWNTLLHAHSRADDLEGGLTNLQNLIGYARLTPDGHSFHPLMEMFAKRGDVDGVEDMLEQYDELTQAPRSTPLLGSLITAFVRCDDIENAERVLRDTVKKVKNGEISGSLTKCFNVVLTAHAVSRDIGATKRVYRWMREQKTELDTDSYSALVFALTSRRQMDAAYKIVTGAMKEAGVTPTAFHFSLIMAGYNNASRMEEASRVHDDMLRLNLKPTSSSNAIHLQTRALQEHLTQNRWQGDPSQPVALETTLRELQQVLESADQSSLSAKTPQAGLHSASPSEADLASHFDFLIFVHGKRRCFDAVRQLYEQYQELATQRGIEHDAPSIRLLTALMSAYWRAGEYDEVEASWKLAKERADVIAPTAHVPSLSIPDEPTSQRGQRVPDALELEPVRSESIEEPSEDDVDAQDPISDKSAASTIAKQTLLSPALTRPSPMPAPARRHILTRPLRYYLAALYRQNRLHDLITTVSSLLRQGYRLDNRTFNYFIECLCRASPPLALLAFTLTERFLIPNFPGWVHTTHRYAYVYGNRPQARAEGLQNIRARYLKPGTLMPQYRVLVRLGSVLLDVRRLEAMGRRSRRKGKGEKERELERYVGTMAQIRSKAPKTLFAVQSMPHRPDRLQSRLLRREG